MNTKLTLPIEFTSQVHGGGSYGVTIHYNTEYNLAFLPGEEELPQLAPELRGSNSRGKGRDLEEPTPSLLNTEEVVIASGLFRGRTVLVIEDKLRRYDTSREGESSDAFVDGKPVREHSLEAQLGYCFSGRGFRNLLSSLHFKGPIVYGFRSIEPLDASAERRFQNFIDPLTGFPFRKRRLAKDLAIFHQNPAIREVSERQRELYAVLLEEENTLLGLEQADGRAITCMPPETLNVVTIPFKVSILREPKEGEVYPAIMGLAPL